MMWGVIPNVSLVHPPTHMCPHTCMQSYKNRGKGRRRQPPVQKVHSIHPLTSHWLETEYSCHTTLCSKTDGNLAPPPKWNPNPESIMWRGISQSLEDKYCMFLLHAEPKFRLKYMFKRWCHKTRKVMMSREEAIPGRRQWKMGCMFSPEPPLAYGKCYSFTVTIFISSSSFLFFISFFQLPPFLSLYCPFL